MHAHHKGQNQFGGWLKDILHDRTVFYLSKVASCVRDLLSLRVYRFGNKSLAQLSGIPIGGPISGAALEVVLCVDEDTFDKFGWPTIANNSISQGNVVSGSPAYATSTTSSLLPGGFALSAWGTS